MSPPATYALRVVAWETTRRCPLSCRHCRGSAREQDYGGELATDEAVRLIDGVASFARAPAPGRPLILILTGGEPMTRPDIYDLARYAAGRGLRVAMSPCGTLIDPAAAQRIREAGIARVSISLDGADAETHDAFRGASGAFAAAVRGVRCLREAGVKFQVNTTVTRLNAGELPAVFTLAKELGAAALDLFFLVPVGRAAVLKEITLSSAETESTLNWVCNNAQDPALPVKVTCAPQYHRILAQRKGETKPDSERHIGNGGCSGGRGFLFVSHRGIVQACGFLDIPCGDLRAEGFDLRTIYHTSPVLRQIRDVDDYHGKCGRCGYRRTCGGCRARAFAHSGDYLGEEPFCLYQPEAGESARG